MDCVFIEIFKIRKQNAKLEIAKTKPIVVVANPIIANDIEKNTKANINGTRLSNLETNQPDIGKPIKELIGIAISMVPSSASFKLKNVFMVGIRDAQEAKQIPDKKK
ncbi:hypothetical protein JCM19274_2436 [Algibacter lectus]|uniref:Uncharacterized protein n=1 Tax=Algibacter lectus TaxID=221126 RepID=A0A090WW42_9FLAO|nr:hypothetical protein JCM19274_2436 [Algibacter lectus]